MYMHGKLVPEVKYIDILKDPIDPCEDPDNTKLDERLAIKQCHDLIKLNTLFMVAVIH